MEVTLNLNDDGTEHALQFLFSTKRNWTVRYFKGSLESFKGTACLDRCLCGKEIEDFFANVSKPCDVGFVKALMNADADSLTRGMMHVEKGELMSYFGLMLDKCKERICPESLVTVRIVMYVGNDRPKQGLRKGMFYPVVREQDDSCLVLRNGNIVTSIPKNSLQFTI